MPYPFPHVHGVRISLRIHHNGKSTDFEQTLGPGTTINLNALTCCILVSSEVSHLIAGMVNPRARNKTARLAHSGYLVRLPEQGRVPLKRIQTAIGACAIRRTAQNKSSLHLFNLTTSQSG